MWPFKKHNLELLDRAKTAAAMLQDIVEETAPKLVNILIGEEKLSENNQLLPYITSELLILGLQVTDRIAFRQLGTSKSSGFMNAILPVIQQELQPPIGSQFERLYNIRNTYYGEFTILYPVRNENLRGTLCGEFVKAIGSSLAKSNPDVIMDISMLAIAFTKLILDAYEKNKVFI